MVIEDAPNRSIAAESSAPDQHGEVRSASHMPTFDGTSWLTFDARDCVLVHGLCESVRRVQTLSEDDASVRGVQTLSGDASVRGVQSLSEDASVRGIQTEDASVRGVQSLSEDASDHGHNIVCDVPTLIAGAGPENIQATQQRMVGKMRSMQEPTGNSQPDDSASRDYYNDPAMDVLLIDVPHELNLDMAKFLSVDNCWRAIADELLIDIRTQKYIKALTAHGGCSWLNFVDLNPRKDLSIRMLFRIMHDLHPNFVGVLAHFHNEDMVGDLRERQEGVHTSSFRDQECGSNDKNNSTLGNWKRISDSDW